MKRMVFLSSFTEGIFIGELRFIIEKAVGLVFIVPIN